MKKLSFKESIAVHLHLYYTDLLPVILGYLVNIPGKYDLYVTVNDQKMDGSLLMACKDALPNASVQMIGVQNKGRDVKPFYTDLGRILLKYDIVCHIHGKKSLFNNGATTGWLEYLLDNLMGSPDTVTRIMEQLSGSSFIGMVYPANFQRMPYWTNTWLSNRGYAQRLKTSLKIARIPNSYFSFPVGNMFWARTEAISPLFELGLEDDDYPPEAGQLDGEIMHALERITPLLSRDRGFKNLIIEKKEHGLLFKDDADAIDFSGYHSGSLELLKKIINDDAISLVSFDIFDTLICRAVLDPEDIFVMMQEKFEEISGQTAEFRTVRRDADALAREELKPGQDVNLNVIYEKIGEVLSLEEQLCDQLKNIELSYEYKLLERRNAVAQVMEYAYDAGKRVILTSDMYLNREQVRHILTNLHVRKYHEIYVSATVGLRKDTRTLFPHILKQESVAASEMLHIGDNEHSDLQIPGDLGIRTFHVMRPAELFSRTKWGKQSISQRTGPLSTYSSMSLAMSLNKIFDDPFPRGESFVNGDLHLFGYYYFGQILLSFVKWVADRAVSDKVERLYFLARDGEILYKIYQLMQKYSDVPLPDCKYIEVSRRSLGITFISDVKQLDRNLSTDFIQGSLRKYIEIRMGIDLLSYPEIGIERFGFSSIDEPVTVPADLERLTGLAYYLFEICKPYYDEQREMALEYLDNHAFFDDAKKAIVDIGYSGTVQNLLNQVSVDPVHGYYMITYDAIGSVINRSGVETKALFGDKINRLSRELPMDKYSLFYEMVLSSLKGTVKKYRRSVSGSILPVYEKVSPGEQQKLEKLPLIHSGILDFCDGFLSKPGGVGLVSWKDHARLHEPFTFFLENPSRKDIDMLAGYSVDDDFCGNGILYWSPPDLPDNDIVRARRYLWRYLVPGLNTGVPANAFVNDKKVGQAPTREETEISAWYQKQYDVLPLWYKQIGHLFKVMKGRKIIRLKLEDVDQKTEFPEKADELRYWYDKEYEVLPLWYKRVGHVIQVFMGKKRIKDIF